MRKRGIKDLIQLSQLYEATKRFCEFLKSLLQNLLIYKPVCRMTLDDSFEHLIISVYPQMSRFLPLGALSHVRPLYRVSFQRDATSHLLGYCDSEKEMGTEKDSERNFKLCTLTVCVDGFPKWLSLRKYKRY